MNEIISKYLELKDQAQSKILFFNSRLNLYSIGRLACVIAILPLFYFKPIISAKIWLFFLIILVIIFIVSVIAFRRNLFQRDLYQTISNINKREVNYLVNGVLDFKNGAEFIDPQHAFSFDIDLYGKSSVFHHLNRTHTYIGHTTFAQDLLVSRDASEIRLRQLAIDELSEKKNWTQNFSAIAEMQEDNQSNFNFLSLWSINQHENLSKSVNILSFLLPVIFVVTIIANYIYVLGASGLIWLLFIINLSVIGSQMKIIQSEISKSTKLNKLLFNFSLLINQIENESWKSELLINLKQKLISSDLVASAEIKSLAKIFSDMDTIHNPFGAGVSNGLSLYHIHILRKLLNWKKEKGRHIMNWLQVIGDFESLISFANLKHNNPSFTFPTLNQNNNFSFKNIGHPLIKPDNRISSSVSFDSQRFIILTGSNMSGKSTFLRSLGVNLILTQAGSVICAEEANVGLAKLFVSMRSSDSLADNESYFFAEVKRLQAIMNQAQDKPRFILLDEILRGTNSDDKRNGTIRYLEKLIGFKAIGVIATHDLEVCKTTNKHPNYLTNKCFEVNIENDELVFDYKLRDGICQNQSASFLMEKYKII